MTGVGSRGQAEAPLCSLGASLRDPRGSHLHPHPVNTLYKTKPRGKSPGRFSAWMKAIQVAHGTQTAGQGSWRPLYTSRLSLSVHDRAHAAGQALSSGPREVELLSTHSTDEAR